MYTHGNKGAQTCHKYWKLRNVMQMKSPAVNRAFAICLWWGQYELKVSKVSRLIKAYTSLFARSTHTARTLYREVLPVDYLNGFTNIFIFSLNPKSPKYYYTRIGWPFLRSRTNWPALGSFVAWPRVFATTNYHCPWQHLSVGGMYYSLLFSFSVLKNQLICQMVVL